MRAIFISYRRDDTEGHAGRLFEDLCERFGKGSVFMDVAGIEPGRDFRRVIEQQVASCGVLLALIGRNWLTVTDAQGKRRLDDPYDFVRLETASALTRDIPVIPVLVQQSVMPRAEQLPDDLKELAFRSSVELSHARWGSDVQLLITALMPYVDPSQPTPVAAHPPPPKPASTRRHTGWAITALAAFALGAVGVVAWYRPHPAPGAPTSAASAPGAPTVAASAPGAPTRAASAPDRIAVASAALQAPALASSPPPLAGAPASASVAVDTGNAPKPAFKQPAVPPPAPGRRIDKPMLAKPSSPEPAPAIRTTVVPPIASPAAPSSPALAAPAPESAELPSPGLSATPAPALSVTPSPGLPVAPSPEIVTSRPDPGLDLLGSPGSVAMVTRTITIRPDTGFVNVTGGEVIRFDVGNKSFVWNFNGRRSSFDLARIAPPSVLDHKVTAYVAPNPLYLRRN